MFCYEKNKLVGQIHIWGKTIAKRSNGKWKSFHGKHTGMFKEKLKSQQGIASGVEIRSDELGEVI